MSGLLNSLMFKFRNFVYLFFAIMACARQGTIPNPDKFPPHLKKVTSTSQTQVSLVFDESLNPGLISANTFTIASNLDTAEIKFVTPDPHQSGTNTFLLITSPLLPQTYSISGMVVDRGNNAAIIKARFTASNRRDTTPPFFSATPSQPHATFPYRIDFSASEPVDTSAKTTVLTAPFSNREFLKLEWDRTLARYRLECKDSMRRGLPFYAVLLPGSQDFSGNRDLFGSSVYVFSDTSVELMDVRGRIRTSEGRPAWGALLVFYEKDSLVALGLADSLGRFIVTLESRSSFVLEAFYDSDFDNSFNERARHEVLKPEDSLEIYTAPLPIPLGADELW